MRSNRKIGLPAVLLGMALITASKGELPGAEVNGGLVPATYAINHLGLDLLARETTGGNTLLSPYSIQAALAMTFAGAEGVTRDEMAHVLHYSGTDKELHKSFAELRSALDEIARVSAERAEAAKKFGGALDPVVLTVANRLYGQKGYDFRSAFLSLVRDVYEAPFQPLDFSRNSAAARQEINRWVEQKTHDRIQDLIPPDGVSRDTRLVLVNAIYLKAPWANPFSESATQPRVFHLPDGTAAEVATMSEQSRFGYVRRDGFTVVTLPYAGGGLQFLILLPDEPTGLPDLQAKLDPETLAECASAPPTDLILRLPKFTMQPPLFRLKDALVRLGMKTAFDIPEGSADFNGIAARKPDDYLFISEIFHKTFLDLDEKGTEAAAATAVSMARPTSAVGPKPKPIEVNVDHPFLFAIQHRSSGACLFLGRMNDPR